MELVAFPSTEAEFRACFADEAQCRAYLAQLRWPGGFRCAHCGGQTAYFLRSKALSPPSRWLWTKPISAGWSTNAPAVAGRSR